MEEFQPLAPNLKPSSSLPGGIENMEEFQNQQINPKVITNTMAVTPRECSFWIN